MNIKFCVPTQTLLYYSPFRVRAEPDNHFLCNQGCQQLLSLDNFVVRSII